MRLHSINLRDLHHLETGQFLVRFFSDFQATGILPSFDAEFQLIFNDINSQLPTYKLALAQVEAEEESKLLVELDNYRDDSVSSLRTAFKPYRKTRSADKKAAYNKLLPVMNNYKDIANENYEAESLGLDNFIASLRSPALFPSVQLLNMEEHLDNLESDNNNFKTTFNNRSNKAVSTITYNTKMLRNNILNAYKEIATYVDTMANRRTSSPNFITVLGAINNGRSYFANIIARRKGGGDDPESPTA